MRDSEPRAFPDTLLRRDMLLRRLRTGATREDVLAALDSHMGADAALCCHPLPGVDPRDQYEMLCTLTLDLAAGRLHAHEGGPCTRPLAA